jgi:hypothetical protein
MLGHAGEISMGLSAGKAIPCFAQARFGKNDLTVFQAGVTLA